MPQGVTMAQSSRAPVVLWVSISGYARIYGVDRSTVYKWLEAGILDAYRVGRCIRLKNQPPHPIGPTRKPAP
jgi:excisionase family DNA binding protein